jgi:hypothetical protein
VHATWLIAVRDCSYLGLSDDFSLIPGALPSADWTLRFEPRDTNDDTADSAKLQYLLFGENKSEFRKGGQGSEGPSPAAVWGGNPRALTGPLGPTLLGRMSLP